MIYINRAISIYAYECSLFITIQTNCMPSWRVGRASFFLKALICLPKYFINSLKSCAWNAHFFANILCCSFLHSVDQTDGQYVPSDIMRRRLGHFLVASSFGVWVQSQCITPNSCSTYALSIFVKAFYTAECIESVRSPSIRLGHLASTRLLNWNCLMTSSDRASIYAAGKNWIGQKPE